MFSALLDQLQPVCVSEQKFVTAFFHFQKVEQPEDFEDVDGEEGEQVRGWMGRGMGSR